jgi:hypothetical protein
MRALAGRDDDVVLDLISGQATALIHPPSPSRLLIAWFRPSTGSAS